jgi:hypothetical protein
LDHRGDLRNNLLSSWFNSEQVFSGHLRFLRNSSHPNADGSLKEEDGLMISHPFKEDPSSSSGMGFPKDDGVVIFYRFGLFSFMG